MDENKIEKLAKEMSEAYGISLDSAASTIAFIAGVASDVSKAIIEIGGLLSDAAGTLWDMLKDYNERLEAEQFINSRQVWPIVWDTRKKSQVISNKPKFLIRKIIR